MSHANAALTPRHRLRMARAIVEGDWLPSVAAEMFMVLTVTARKWAARYRAEGVVGVQDRSSRPRSCPHHTSPQVVRKIVELPWRQRLGLVQIGGRLGVAPSTVHAVLVRCRLSRLSRIDRVTGEPIRRYERPHPRGKDYKPRTGKAFLHTVIVDHSRVAYGGADEKADTAVGVFHRAVAWFPDHGVTVERVLFDNDSCYRSFAWRDSYTELDIIHKRPRPYGPQTNGKTE